MYAELMPEAYSIWEWLEKESSSKLFEKSGIINISAADDGSTQEIEQILTKMNVECSVMSAQGRNYFLKSKNSTFRGEKKIPNIVQK